MGAPTITRLEIEIAASPLHDFQLLIVFLAKDRDIGPALVEKFRNDGRNARKMGGPEAILESGRGRTAHGKRGRKAWRIDMRLRGRENQIAFRRSEFRHIRFERARIGGKIFR